MSLLTAFGILFETDSKEASDDTKKLRKELEGTETAAKGATGSMDDVGDAAHSSGLFFNGMTSAIAGTVASLVSLGAVSAAVMSRAFAVDDLGKFSETLGLNIEKLDAWGAAAQRNGGSAEAFRGSVAGLNGALTDISLTGGGDAAEVLARLGISATDSAGRIRGVFDILPEIADAFQNLSKAESVGFGSKLGLDQGTILLLQQGRDSVEALVEQQKALGIVTKEDYEAAAKFRDTWDDTKRVFWSVVTTGSTTILPFLVDGLELVQDFVNWTQQHSDVVVGFFSAIAAVVTATYLPAMVSAAAATLAATWPIVLIVAAIAAAGVAIGLIYEDIQAYINGFDSLIGRLAEKFEAIQKIIDNIKKVLNYDIGDTDVSANLNAAIQTGEGLPSYMTTNQPTYNNYDVRVGGSTINTQATDPQAVRNEIDSNLSNQIDMIRGQFSDGVEG
jgi:hypothetical protein